MQDSGHTPDWTGPTVERVLSNGKRMFAKVFKDWMVVQAIRPEVSVAGLALKYGVNANQLRRWVTLERRRTTPRLPAVLPVMLEGPRPPEAATQPRGEHAAVIEIELAGARIHVPRGVDGEHLRVVLQALRS